MSRHRPRATTRSEVNLELVKQIDMLYLAVRGIGRLASGAAMEEADAAAVLLEVEALAVCVSHAADDVLRKIDDEQQ